MIVRSEGSFQSQAPKGPEQIVKGIRIKRSDRRTVTELAPSNGLMQSNEKLVQELRTAPWPWVDAAIVVAFGNRFEFVTEDFPDALSRLNFLQSQGGLAIAFAGQVPGVHRAVFSAELFPEFRGQAWAHRYLDILREIVWNQDSQK
jgi:hypothetical protein